MISFKDFCETLVYLGGNIGISASRKVSKYVDLEKFVVDSTLFMDKDSRVTKCFLNWIWRYGIILSPSKLRRVLRRISDYNPYVLTAIVSLLEDNPQNLQNWSIIKPFCKKHKKVTKLFKTFPISTGNVCVHFKNANILAKPFKSEEEKFLKSKDFVIKNCPEIRYRSEGLPQVISDLKAYIDKVKYRSLYEIAKNTYNERNRINQSFHYLSFLGTISAKRTF